jgi:hypothetical protein
VLVDLLFFPFGGKDHHELHFSIWTCPHFGAKLACRRPGTKYCVGLFFLEHFGTLPPEVIFTSVSSDPTFHHGLCFFASVATFLFAIISPYPYLGEYCASTSGTLLGALAALPASASATAAAEDTLLSRRQIESNNGLTNHGTN